jgi:hypothetical protein
MISLVTHKIRYLSFFILWIAFTPGFSQVISGELDLRGFTFPYQIALDGQWEFYWGELLDPDELSGEGKNFSTFPSLWNELAGSDPTISPFGSATYKLTIILPDQPADYALFVDDMYTSYKLFIDGKVVGSNGVVSIDKETYRPEFKPIVIPLFQKSKKLKLVLQVSNYYHSKGGTTQSLMFGDYTTVYSTFDLKRKLDLSLASIFFILGVLFLVRFSFTLAGYESFFFALFCLFFIYRVLGANFYVLHQFIDEYPWELGMRLEYLSIYISATFFGLHVYKMYPNEMNRYFFFFFLVFNAVFILLASFSGTVFLSRLVMPYLVFLFFSFFYAFTVYIFAMGKGIRGATMGVISGGVFFMVMSFNILNYLDVLPRLHVISFLGFAVFMLFQTLQLVQHKSVSEKDYL